MDTITLGISLYRLEGDCDEPDPAISSHRTEGELLEILDRMNDIWAPAGIRLEAKTVSTIKLPKEMLTKVTWGDVRVLLQELGGSVEPPGPGLINGFFSRSLGGPNGISFPNSRIFMVADEPSVFDRRVSSHEVGHILGLPHTSIDPHRLLFSGTNGMSLTDNEITIARMVASELLESSRE
ncbi:MAG: hypothetical protein BZY88_15885 [SAR202 cluster bacterium Io17-Chloro-G9]|nr:MAG: hypothetical protein BZY88_15885 [SAR202 cluster bacterium Io17-Chloro-G9]